MGMSQHYCNSREKREVKSYNRCVQRNPLVIRYPFIFIYIFMCVFIACLFIYVSMCLCVCVCCSTSPRASRRQSVWSATEPRVQATTQAAECLPAPTTRRLPHMLPGTHLPQTYSCRWAHIHRRFFTFLDVRSISVANSCHEDYLFCRK